MTSRSDILALVVGACVLVFARQPILVGADPEHVFTCEQLLPTHQQNLDHARRAYLAALTAHGLREAQLAQVPIGDWPGLPTIEELDERVGRSAAAWEVLPFVHEGVEQQAIAGEIIDAQTSGRADPEFVTDAKGDIWRVVRRPHVLLSVPLKVDACQWGCWGSPPAGMPPPIAFRRTLYLLPKDATFRGHVIIGYDEPTLDTVNVQNCNVPA